VSCDKSVAIEKTNLDDHHDQREKYHHDAQNFTHRVHLQVKKSNLITSNNFRYVQQAALEKTQRMKTSLCMQQRK